MMHEKHRGGKGLIYQNWWVVFFITLCTVIYFNAIGKKHQTIAHLDSQMQALATEKASLLQEKEELLLQIHSQSDPAWIRLTLMKGLGLVPEGQLKVYFYSDGD